MASLNVLNNGIIFNDGTGTVTIGIDDSFTDFCELVLVALGIDIKYEEFKNMTKEERKSLIRDIKINKLINE